MKFSVLALAVVVGLATAQNLSGEPACATSCLLSAISAASCAPTDVACQCALDPSVVGPCLIGACNAADLQQALTVGTNLCKSYSATATGNTTVSSTIFSNTTTASTVLSTSSVPFSNTTTVTAKTTSFTSTRTRGSTSSPSPTSTSSRAGAPALVAGIGGVVGMLGLVAAL